MRNVYIRLPGPEEVQCFVDTLSPLAGDFDLVADGYILDARSLMGIFSLDLSKPLQLRVYQDSPQTMQLLQPFIADNTQGGLA